MTTISAKTILRSRNASAPDKVLSTLLLRYPRFIHAEFMTHRALSRNAASSRAIPVKKMIDDILADTAMPIHWGANQKGMQADKECDEWVGWDSTYGQEGYGTRQHAWFSARDHAIKIARGFDAAGYHKQVINRLLEPFLHITVLASATEWGNFLELRDHKDAEPHIQILAREIRACLEDESTIQTLEPGYWHLPFLTVDEMGCSREDAFALSVARCASTSFKTTDGFDMTMERAGTIYEKLHTKPFHASPFEHVAQADSLFMPVEVWQNNPRRNDMPPWNNRAEHGNFVGFRQLRRQLELA